MNKVILTGRLTKDVECKMSKNNKEYCDFTLAVQRDFKNPDGEYEADFINCRAFNNPASVLSRYAEKGDKIGVEGSIRTSSYEKDGSKVYTTGVLVDKVEFHFQRKETNKENQKPIEAEKSVYSDAIELTDDDLPF